MFHNGLEVPLIAEHGVRQGDDCSIAGFLKCYRVVVLSWITLLPYPHQAAVKEFILHEGVPEEDGAPEVDNQLPGAIGVRHHQLELLNVREEPKLVDGSVTAVVMRNVLAHLGEQPGPAAALVELQRTGVLPEGTELLVFP